MLNTTNTGIIKEIPTASFLVGNNVTGGAPFLKHFRKEVFNLDGKVVATADTDTSNGHYNNSLTKLVPEGEDITIERGIKWDSAMLKPKRFAHKLTIPETVLLDTEADLISVGEELAVRHIFKEIENHLLLTGYILTDTDEVKKTKMQRLFHGSNLNSQTMIDRANVAYSHETLLQQYQVLNKQNNTNGAFWLFDLFPKISVIHDQTGDEMLKFDNLPEGAVATYLGLPVYQARHNVTDGDGVTDFGAHSIVAPQYYTVMMNDKIKVTKTQQTKAEAMNGVHSYIFELWADGAITDKYARQSIKLLPYGTTL